MDHRPNVRAKTTKLLEENRENVYDLRYGKIS